jgi:hypothetical protein
MPQHSLKRLLFVTLLAGGLAFAGPAQVHAAPVGPSQGLWQWLTRVWEEGLTVVRGQPGVDHHTSNGDRRWTKQGGCIDPNGCVNSAVPTTGRPACGAWTTAGACIDPNH